MILLVDDDSHLLEEAESVLHRSDGHVLFARDAAQARSLMKSIKFSLALVDLNLPDCNGFELIGEMHQSRPELPILAFSGVYSRNVLESAKAFGAVDVLTKPPTPEWAAAVAKHQLTPAE
jgi:DNA-binding NtrC family response regulator